MYKLAIVLYIYAVKHTALMYYSSHSHPTVALMPSESILTKFRLNGCALVLLCQCLVLALPMLKFLRITNVADWSWFWATAPIWGPGALLLVMLTVERIADLRKPVALRRPTLVGEDIEEADFSA